MNARCNRINARCNRVNARCSRERSPNLFPLNAPGLVPVPPCSSTHTTSQIPCLQVYFSSCQESAFVYAQSNIVRFRVFCQFLCLNLTLTCPFSLTDTITAWNSPCHSFSRAPGLLASYAVHMFSNGACAHPLRLLNNARPTWPPGPELVLMINEDPYHQYRVSESEPDICRRFPYSPLLLPPTNHCRFFSSWASCSRVTSYVRSSHTAFPSRTFFTLKPPLSWDDHPASHRSRAITPSVIHGHSHLTPYRATTSSMFSLRRTAQVVKLL